MNENVNEIMPEDEILSEEEILAEHELLLEEEVLDEHELLLEEEILDEDEEIPEDEILEENEISVENAETQMSEESLENEVLTEDDLIMLSSSDIKTICSFLMLIVFIVAMIFELSNPESLAATAIMFITFVIFIFIAITDRD